MNKPRFFTREDMERIVEQGIDPSLLPSAEIAKEIQEYDIRLEVYD